jgi:hypothetical protein
MTISISNNANQKKCELCGSSKTTYMIVTKNRTHYGKWERNPFKEDILLCSPIHVRRSNHIARTTKRVRHKRRRKMKPSWL